MVVRGKGGWGEVGVGEEVRWGKRYCGGGRCYEEESFCEGRSVVSIVCGCISKMVEYNKVVFKMNVLSFSSLPSLPLSTPPSGSQGAFPLHLSSL